ncbi:MAG: hypothetical protein GXZ19_00515 [Bacteroidales bacterium]|nr:hypothetical protein [Bacteroidales bacterium]
MADFFFENIRNNTDWLHCLIVEYKLFYIDLWSFIHLVTGAALLLLLSASGSKRVFTTLFLLLVLFEITEISFFIGVLKLFMPEKTLDVFNDIAIGMLGGWIIHIILIWKRRAVYAKWIFAAISAAFVSFVWVGWYGYSYNHSFFNSSCINWWALTCWSFSGFLIIVINYHLEKKINFPVAFFITSVIYLAALVVVEYIAYHSFHLHETTLNANPMIFNIIHGNKTMHIYYLTAPLFYILVFKFSNHFLKKYEKGVSVVK